MARRRFWPKRMGKLAPKGDTPPEEPIATGHLCDACHRALAVYSATHYGIMRTLVFCAAHFRKHKNALEAKGWHFGEAK